MVWIEISWYSQRRVDSGKNNHLKTNNKNHWFIFCITWDRRSRLARTDHHVLINMFWAFLLPWPVTLSRRGSLNIDVDIQLVIHDVRLHWRFWLDLKRPWCPHSISSTQTVMLSWKKAVTFLLLYACICLLNRKLGAAAKSMLALLPISPRSCSCMIAFLFG